MRQTAGSQTPGPAGASYKIKRPSRQASGIAGRGQHHSMPDIALWAHSDVLFFP
jgi:hypothetical protein